MDLDVPLDSRMSRGVRPQRRIVGLHWGLEGLLHPRSSRTPPCRSAQCSAKCCGSRPLHLSFRVLICAWQVVCCTWCGSRSLHSPFGVRICPRQIVSCYRISCYCISSIDCRNFLVRVASPQTVLLLCHKILKLLLLHLSLLRLLLFSTSSLIPQTSTTIMPHVGYGGIMVVESRKNGHFFRGIIWWNYLVGSSEFPRPPARAPAPPRAPPRALGSGHPAPRRGAPFAARSLCFPRPPRSLCFPSAGPRSRSR